MPTFERAVVIDAPAAELFWLMQDYELRLAWDPFLREARLIDADRAALGVRAWCVDHRGRGMETEYVSFQPPHRVAVRMTRGPWMFRALSGAWLYRAIEPGRTEVAFRYHVEARPRLGRVTDWVLERVFAAEMRDRLAALKQAVETTDVLDRVRDQPIGQR